LFILNKELPVINGFNRREKKKAIKAGLRKVFNKELTSSFLRFMFC